MAKPPVIHWFRQDLRFADNPALTAAAAAGPVIAVYVLDDAAAGDWPIGGASRWWLERSLRALDRRLAHSGIGLIARKGDTAAILTALAAECGAAALHFTRCYEPHAVALEGRVKSALEARGVAVRRYAGSLLFEPESIRTGSGGPFKVFTPFSRACLGAPEPRRPLPAPVMAPCDTVVAGGAISALGLYPGQPDWAAGFDAQWRPGEEGAMARLDDFLASALPAYRNDRDRPDLAATSRLSPHLHFGELSPNTVWHRTRALAAHDPRAESGAEKFIAELLWREFSAHLLAQFPALPEQPFRPDFAAFPWSGSAAQLRAWQRGLTGYPIVDAGMRELWSTGTMHNRVRMIAASFLIKDLLISWRQGEAWFWDTLVDADLASNAASWQWVAGSGADAAPYFRIFNPVTQGRKFDPDGAYVRRFVPELSRLPAALIHAPWEVPPMVLAAAGVRLGETYPQPIVDHAKARAAALVAYGTVKGSRNADASCALRLRS